LTKKLQSELSEAVTVAEAVICMLMPWQEYQLRVW